MLDIPTKTEEKLGRYLINADPFLWGTLKSKNKKARLKELRENGFLTSYSEGSNPVYSRIINDLIIELGVKGIFELIVIPRITDLFTKDQLAYMRRCWEQGQTPALEYFKNQTLYQRHIFRDYKVREGWDNRTSGYREPSFIFVDINSQFGFVERWTTFASLWFEEIEPLLH